MYYLGVTSCQLLCCSEPPLRLVFVSVTNSSCSREQGFTHISKSRKLELYRKDSFLYFPFETAGSQLKTWNQHRGDWAHIHRYRSWSELDVEAIQIIPVLTSLYYSIHFYCFQWVSSCPVSEQQLSWFVKFQFTVVADHSLQYAHERPHILPAHHVLNDNFYLKRNSGNKILQALINLPEEWQIVPKPLPELKTKWSSNILLL